MKFTSVFETLLVAEKRAKMTDFVLKGLANGTLKPVIDKTFPLENIVEAHRYFESNQHVGKVVVTVGNQNHRQDRVSKRGEAPLDWVGGSWQQ